MKFIGLKIDRSLVCRPFIRRQNTVEDEYAHNVDRTQ